MLKIKEKELKIYNEIKNYILQLEKARKVYFNKIVYSTTEDTKNFYRGMEHSVLACINDLKKIVGDENER